MKKNVMMRLASFLLVAVLISTSAISGTYAKYVTADSGSDMARVAKFGVTVDVAGTMFAEAYERVEDGNEAISAGAGADVVTVRNDGSHGVVNKLVAPGTTGKMTEIQLSGKPEVDVAVTYTANVTLDGWATPSKNFYCPLVFTISGPTGDRTVNGLDFDTAAGLKNELETVVKEYSKTYDANTDLSGQQADNLDITWVWPFSTSDANDVNDTFLGDAAAGLYAGHGASTINVEVTCTVTQVD